MAASREPKTRFAGPGNSGNDNRTPPGPAKVLPFPDMKSKIPPDHTHRERMGRRDFLRYLEAAGMRLPKKLEALLNIPPVLFKRADRDSFSSISEAGIEFVDLEFERLGAKGFSRVGSASPYGIILAGGDSGTYMLLVDEERKVIVKADVRPGFSEASWEVFEQGLKGALNAVQWFEKANVPVRYVISRDGNVDNSVRE